MKVKEYLFQLKRWISLIFSYPKLDIKKVDYDAYWQSKRGGEIGKLSDWQKDRANIIRDNLEHESSVLDVGCGDGSILAYLKDNIRLGKLFGADSSSFALNKAEASGIKTYKIDISDRESLEKLPNVDYILLLEILEHIQNPEEVLATLLSKAKKGVFFSFPNTGFIVYRLRLFFGRFPMQWRLHPSEHLRFWTYRDLRWWLKELGHLDKSKIIFYRGIFPFEKIWPGLFGAAFVVKIRKEL